MGGYGFMIFNRGTCMLLELKIKLENLFPTIIATNVSHTSMQIKLLSL